MRAYLKFAANNRIIPFNYQELLTSAIHKWLGRDNEMHGQPDQFCFSWIQNTTAEKKGIRLHDGAYFFISAASSELIKRIIKGILKDTSISQDIVVTDIQIVTTPEFGTSEEFLMASPVLIKARDEDGKVKHITIRDDSFEELLTENLKNKLRRAGLSPKGVSVKLSPESNFRQTKLVTYKGIKNKTSVAPVVIEGTPEQIAFTWCVGLGNSTGIGFGALK